MTARKQSIARRQGRTPRHRRHPDREEAFDKRLPHTEPKLRELFAKLQAQHGTGEDGWFQKAPEIVVPAKNPVAEVTLRVAVGGKDWKEGAGGGPVHG